jgi:fido (protein-threonine AMPylation protein)
MDTSKLTAPMQNILDVLANCPDGASIAQIESVMAAHPATLRTLQRWLAELIELGLVRRDGKGRASRYLRVRVISVEVQEKIRAQDATSAAPHIPLSVAGKEVAVHVGQPIMLRTPIGYNRQFLDTYRPNQTFYLDEALRADLFAHGRAVAADEPAGTYARQIAHRLLIDLSWNSSRLEGNTYSLLETERLLSAGQAAAGKDAFEAQMILNHKEAIEFLISSADEIGFNRYTVLNLHALLSDNLLTDPTASGRLRSIAVGIGQTTFVPLEGPQRIEECFDQILATAATILDPFEQAIFVMVHLPYLQPFEDVNKRVSRLAANIPLIRHNLCPLSFVDVSQPLYVSAMLGIYEINRIELLRDLFVWAYKRSCARYSAFKQSISEPDPFRIRHRQLIADTVTQVVRSAFGKQQAIALVRLRAHEQLPPLERARFIEITETQLMSLHEGSIARYRLRPSEYQAWRARWK